MAGKIYIAELDAKVGAIMAKMDSIEKKMTSTASRGSTAFDKLGATLVTAFSAREILTYINHLQELGMKVINVKNAFQRLNDPNLLSNLRKSTRGTIDDLTLMQSANFANKMRIPMDLLAKGMEFAGLTALETGQDINYMMESFVTGTARESEKILDNLGISAKGLSAEVKKTGNFMQAVSNIMDTELGKMRGNIDDTTLSMIQLNVQAQNHEQIISEKVSRVWNMFVRTIFPAVDTALSEITQKFEGLGLFLDVLSGKENIGVLFGDVTKAQADNYNKLLRDALSLGGRKVEQTKEEIPWLKQQQNRLKEIGYLIAGGNLSQSEYVDLLKEQDRIQSRLNLKKEKEVDLQKLLTQSASLAGRTSRGFDQSGLRPVDFSDNNFQMKRVDDWTMMILDWKRNQDSITDSVDQSAEQMNAMVGLSSQIASNFNLAGHTFVGQLSQAVSMLTGISNIILTIASIFGHQASSFGFGGLLGLLGLEKGGRVKLTGSNLSISNIPSFAAGGSYSTPSFAGPMYGGGYPVMVHKNETLDVYNSGQTSRMERMLGEIKNAILTTNVHVSKKNTSGQSINVHLDGKKLFTVNTAQSNRAGRSGKNLGDII